MTTGRINQVSRLEFTLIRRAATIIRMAATAHEFGGIRGIGFRSVENNNPSCVSNGGTGAASQTTTLPVRAKVIQTATGRDRTTHGE